MGNKEKMPLYEWIDQINNAQPSLHRMYNDNDMGRYKKLVYENTYNRLLNILLKMYKWKLPDTIPQRSIELGLINRGQLCVFTDKKLGSYALPCIPQSLYNIYGDPTQVQVFGYNGWQKLVDIEYQADIPVELEQINESAGDAKGVYCRDNDLTYPYINYVEQYAKGLSDKIVALYIATQKLKTPFRFAINDIDLKDTVDMMVSKIESNDDCVIVVKGNKLDGKGIKDAIQPLETNVSADIITGLKDSINFEFNMFLETIGLNTNPSPDKSEVVLTPELESNNSVIDLESDVRFLNRKKLCEDAKAILGIEMSVEKNLNEAKQEANKVGEELNEDKPQSDEVR